VRTCPSCGQANPEGARFCNACGALIEAAPAAREQRKTVTVLFCDVTGSTALGESTDPEALRAVLARYFERMKGILESHGGSVEKFIGDAVMAVFGVPQVHEDDALRACRAAVEMRDALPQLGLQGRIGLNTGEVVTGTEERLATGDAVNVAARLEQAAQPGEILIGADTLRLVRDAVETEPVAPLELKGKAEAVPAHRLLAATGDLVRRDSAPMVGRATELRRLHDAYEQAVRDRSCQLFTVLGSAGVGKSRLAYEFLSRLDATVVRGRCLSYGEGITYFPVVEVLTQLAVRPEDAAAAAAVASVLGETEDRTTSDEIAWGFRKTLEQAAAESPLVCVFDDIHWAEPALLELLEHLTDWSRDAPILLLCMARPELLDRQPGWAGGKINATTVLLEPLSADETEILLQELGGVDSDLRDKILVAADGNPLFVEEMLAMVRGSAGGDVTVPPTIQALLAARLDHLETSERALLERGAVEGKVFHRGAVQALAPDEMEVPQRLMGLVRKELVRPDRAMFPGEDAFRFRHLLIRDAAYDGLPKSARADLHERFALWLDERGPDLVELDEVVGYHLEQSCRYRDELGLPQEEALRAAAHRRLAAAAEKAAARGDYPASATLLERALKLVPGNGIALELEFDLQHALFHTGRIQDALARAALLAERGRTDGNRIAQLSGLLWEHVVRIYTEPDEAVQRLKTLWPEAEEEFARANTEIGLYLVNFARGSLDHLLALFADEVEAMDRAMEHAARAGHRQWVHELLPMAGASRVHGPMPVHDALAWIDEQEGRGVSLPSLIINRAMALALLGRFDEARNLAEQLIASSRERGAVIPLALTCSHVLPAIELAAGNPAAAIAAGEEGRRILEEIGEKSWLSTGLARLGDAHVALGHLGEADELAGRAADLGGVDDALTQMLWRQVRARVLSARGEHGDARQLAIEAVAIGEPTDMLESIGDAHVVLGDVLAAGGDRVGAATSYGSALSLFEQKGAVVAERRTRERLDSLLELEQ
jgi:class 3 adenylate cyclase/tetratricopeptide (TPR) repeat protein